MSAVLVLPSAEPSNANDYARARMMALSAVVSDREAFVMALNAEAMRNALALTHSRGKAEARTAMRSQRDREFHQHVLQHAPRPVLDALLTATEVSGLDAVQSISTGARPLLFFGIHFHLSTVLVPLWLGCHARGALGIQRLVLLHDSGPDGRFAFPAERIRRLAESGLGDGVSLSLVDARHPTTAAREMRSILRSGGAVLLFPDGRMVPASADSQKQLTIQLGRTTMTLPRGVQWLVSEADCWIVPVHTQPRQKGHRLVFGSPILVSSNHEAGLAVEAAFRQLISATIIAKPGLWAGWAGLDQLCRSTAGEGRTLAAPRHFAN